MKYYMRKGNYQAKKRDNRDYDRTTLVIAVLDALAMIWAFWSKPEVKAFHTGFIITNGIILGGLIMGTIIWSFFELFTHKARHWYDAVIKVIIAYPIGLILGGIIAYLTDFGKLVLIPARSGNIFALFFLLSIFVFVMIEIGVNVWYHNKTVVRW